MSEPDWRVLARWKPAAFDAEAFEIVRKDAVRAKKAICSEFPDIKPTAWSRRALDLAHHFGTGVPVSCLASQAHEWARFLEPQITKGFAHFLMSGDLGQRRARCLAFVRAALACQGNRELPPTFAPTSVEAIAEEERIDLLVQLEEPSGTFGAVIEAKFGHRLTNQLQKAEEQVLRVRKWRKGQSAFLVLSREPISASHTHMRESWHSASWWTFLRHLDRVTTESSDCEDYRRFRRTVWLQAYEG
jgi:hypothetical protein